MSMYAYWLANTGLTVHKLTGLMTEGIGAEELYALQESQMKKIVSCNIPQIYFVTIDQLDSSDIFNLERVQKLQ